MPINTPSLLSFVSLSILTIVVTISAQCVDPGFVPCYPAGSQLGGIPTDNFDDTSVWASLQSITNGAILRRDLTNRLAARQDALCCNPDPAVQCLVLTDGNIPFCYDTQTTRFVFSDSSFGYDSNGTYYAADGTFVDYDKGYYSATDGSVETFAPATSTATGPRSTKANTKASAASTATHAAGAAQPATNTAVTPTQTPTKQSSSAVKGVDDVRFYVLGVAGGLGLAALGSLFSL